MIGFWNKKVSRRLFEMQAEPISVNQLKKLIYDNKYEPVRIWGSTEGKTPGHPRRTLRGEQVYSIQGPRNEAPWNKMGTNAYINEGYVILYDINKTGFRTFPFKRITKIEIDNQLYRVK